MKKFFLSAIVICMAMLFSCGNKTTATDSSSDSDSIVGAALDTADTTSTAFGIEKIKYKKTKKNWTYESDVDYPVKGSPALVENVRHWINEVLANGSFAEDSGPLFKGDLNNGKAMLEFHGKNFLKTISAEDYADVDDECEEDEGINFIYEDDKYITYLCNGYWYAGGPHGSTTIHGATFRKDTGKMLTWDDFREGVALRSAIVDQLKKYFQVKSDDELIDNLLLMDESATISDIPYPAFEPWIDKEGLNMIYQQYEIACYAAGMPTVVIPTDKMQQFIKE